MRITESAHLSDIVKRDVTTLPLLMRFGLFPGYGSRSIAVACREAGVETELFLAVLRAFLDESEVGRDDIALIVDSGQFVDFLESTDEWYQRVQLPNIERHFTLLMRQSGETPWRCLEALQGFYAQLKDDFRRRFEFDRQTLFPILRETREKTASDDGESAEALHRHIEEAFLYDERLEEEMADMLNYFIIHIESGCDPNLFVAVVTAIANTDRDLRQTNRIRRLLGKEEWLNRKGSKTSFNKNS